MWIATWAVKTLNGVTEEAIKELTAQQRPNRSNQVGLQYFAQHLRRNQPFPEYQETEAHYLYYTLSKY